MRKGLLFATLLLLGPAATEAVETIGLDLADDGGRFIVAAGTEVEFEILHRLPGGSYSYKVTRVGLLTPLPSDVLGMQTGATAPTSACDQILDDLAAAGNGDSEAGLRSALLRAKAQAPDGPCLERIDLYEKGARAKLAGRVTVGEGQCAVVSVERSEPSSKSWEFEACTGQDRTWLIHYGFAFLPDEDEEFATRAVEGDGEEGDGEEGGGDGDTGFEIVETGRRSEAEFEPVIAFTYLPRTLGNSPWVPKFTAGLGADIEEQLVFAGLSWVIGDNVNLFVGAAGHEQTRLKGIYDPGQVVEATLEPDQLVDETYDVSLIFGVGFRFDRNPFKKSDPATPATDADEGGEDDGEGDGDEEEKPGEQDDEEGEEDNDDNDETPSVPGSEGGSR